jgi:hypothetical protein
MPRMRVSLVWRYKKAPIQDKDLNTKCTKIDKKPPLNGEVDALQE